MNSRLLPLFLQHPHFLVSQKKQLSPTAIYQDADGRHAVIVHSEAILGMLATHLQNTQLAAVFRTGGKGLVDGLGGCLVERLVCLSLLSILLISCNCM